MDSRETWSLGQAWGLFAQERETTTRQGTQAAVPRSGPERSGAAACGPKALRLDQGDNNSPRQDAEIRPEWRAGKFDPEGGKAPRTRDLRRFESLIRAMRSPVLITLTMDRSKFETPADAYTTAMRFVSRLLSDRMGVTVWGRVIEVQTSTGDGWIHWHVVAEMAGTEFDGSHEHGRRWVYLRNLQAVVKSYWCDRWGFGQKAGQDIQLVKSREGIVGYLAGYVVKAWPAIPQWIGDRKCMRLVGFSKAANVMLRAHGHMTPRREPRDGVKTRAKRALTSIFDRLAGSGLTCKVIAAGEYLGRLPVKWFDLLNLTYSGECKGLRVEERTYENPCSTITKLVVIMTSATRESVAALASQLAGQGFEAACKAEREERLLKLRRDWREMQIDHELSCV